MAKTMTITDPETKKTYTLEYTRKTVERMERMGFVAEDVTKKPMSMLPTLFAGAFMAHHNQVKRETIDKIYDRLGHRDQLIGKLVEMYNEPIIALLDENTDEGNLEWSVDW